MTESLTKILDRMLLDPGYLALARSLVPEAGSPTEGAVFGLVLEDGRRAALKIHLPEASAQHLATAVSVQRFLRARGFPCTAVLRDPFDDGTRTITFEEWDTPGEERDAAVPEVRDAMARLLARQVREAALWPDHSRLKPDR